MFHKLKTWIKGRLLARKQLHDPNDPANQALEAVANMVESKAEAALVGVVEQEASKL